MTTPYALRAPPQGGTISGPAEPVRDGCWKVRRWGLRPVCVDVAAGGADCMPNARLRHACR